MSRAFEEVDENHPLSLQLLWAQIVAHITIER